MSDTILKCEHSRKIGAMDDCLGNRLLARHWKLAVQRACFPLNYKRLSEFSLYFFQQWVSIGRLDTNLAKTLFGITGNVWAQVASAHFRTWIQDVFTFKHEHHTQVWHGYLKNIVCQISAQLVLCSGTVPRHQLRTLPELQRKGRSHAYINRITYMYTYSTSMYSQKIMFKLPTCTFGV